MGCLSQSLRKMQSRCNPQSQHCNPQCGEISHIYNYSRLPTGSLKPNLKIWQLLLQAVNLGYQCWFTVRLFDVTKLQNAGLSIVRAKRIESYFREESELRKKVWNTSLFFQVVLIFSIKPISSSISSRNLTNNVAR